MEAGTTIAIGQVTAKVLSTVWKYYSEAKDAKDDIMSLADELEDFRTVVTKLRESLQKKRT